VSFSVRDGFFDVAVVAGPRLSQWPSVGVRTLSALCAEMGLKVGLFGGRDLVAMGVVPLAEFGGVILAQDLQKRIHRIQARSIVRFSPVLNFPDPFPGWRSPGLISIETARYLARESHVSWVPSTVILGTSNQAFQFGSSLIEQGVYQVYCVESFGKWNAKKYSGWEVEKRRFESLGGKIIYGTPIELKKKGALIWELRIQLSDLIQRLEVARVVSAGPFIKMPQVREYPPGSFLFEIDQTALEKKEQDVESWVKEEEHGRWLACKIIKSLVTDLGDQKNQLENIFRRSKKRLKFIANHREEPFDPKYDGKLIDQEEMNQIKKFSGIPQKAYLKRAVVSIECFESITCNLCEKSCPESAIKINRNPKGKESFLIESDCTACGVCLDICPSSSITLIDHKDDQSLVHLTFSWRGKYQWKNGESAILVNRLGDKLGTVRVDEVIEISSYQGKQNQLVQVKVPIHLAWDGRGIHPVHSRDIDDETYLASLNFPEDKKVEIMLEGEKRLARQNQPISIALFEMGRERSGDILFCSDGSCGLCQILVDGNKKLACQEKIHSGLSLKFLPNQEQSYGDLCPCSRKTSAQVRERIENGQLNSPEAVLSATHVGEGRCHGQLCASSTRRLLFNNGIESSNWIDWRFPWVDWKILP